MMHHQLLTWTATSLAASVLDGGETEGAAGVGVGVVAEVVGEGLVGVALMGVPEVVGVTAGVEEAGLGL
jgi:hypothetical protein